MLFSKRRDISLRAKFLYLETKIKLIKYLKINLLAKAYYLKATQSYLLKAFRIKKNLFKLKRISKVQLTRRCLLTNKSRNVSKSSGFSRSVFRDLMRFGIVPGYKKAVW